MSFVARKWNSALYSHRQQFLEMLSERNMIRIAAQVSNLVEDHTKMPKTLEQWCPPAFNLIVLYKPPYSDDQAH